MTAQEVIRVAVAEEGYLEKKTNAYLDDKTKNAGSNSNNFTKYARDCFPDLQGQSWCGMFVGWCFIKAYGTGNASRMLNGLSTAYTPTFANQFKRANRWYTKPQTGDVIFFHNATRICHVGIVEKVVGSTVYTIEGNTSSAKVVVANGGGVFQKSYDVSNPRISGYGRPLYTEDAQQPSNPSSHVPLNYKVGTVYTVQQEMNVRTKKASEGPTAIPNGKVIGTRPKGSKVTCQATTLVNGKIWMYVGLDGGKREQWICADSGTKSYIA